MLLLTLVLVTYCLSPQTAHGGRIAKGAASGTLGGTNPIFFPTRHIVFVAPDDDAYLKVFGECSRSTIDNVLVIEQIRYVQHSGDLGDTTNPFHPPYNTYFIEPDSAATYPLLHLFDEDSESAWLEGNAYFDATSSAPRNPNPVQPPEEWDYSGGRLLFNKGSIVIPIEGLVPGTEYHLMFWVSYGDLACEDYLGQTAEYFEFLYGLYDDIDDLPGFETCAHFSADIILNPGEITNHRGRGDERGAVWVPIDDDVFPYIFVLRDSQDGWLVNPVGELGSELGDRFTDHSTLVEGYPYFGTPHILEDIPSVAATWIDADGDGYDDLYVTHPSGDNSYYDGYLMQVESTIPDCRVQNPVLAQAGAGPAIAWADYDQDGDLDVFVSDALGTNSGQLLRRVADTYAPVVVPALQQPREVVDAAWGDHDEDGDLDLYLSVQDGANLLLQNEGAGVLSEATPVGLTDPADTRTAAWVDFDDDDDLDLHLVNRGAPDRLFRNDGGGAFVDVAVGTPLADPGPGSAGNWADFDNDGDQDVFVTAILGPNRFFRNDGPAGFVEATTEAAQDPAGVSLGSAIADYDHDGTPDLYVINNGTSCRLLRCLWQENLWLKIRLEGLPPNTSAVGAKVAAREGRQWQYRRVTAESHAGCQDDRTIHFGLGPYINSKIIPSVDEIRIWWPSGQESTLYSVTMGRTVVVQEPLPDCQVAPRSLDFGLVDYGVDEFREFTITNNGAGTLAGDIVIHHPELEVDPMDYNLAPGQDQIFQVNWKAEDHCGFDGEMITFTAGCSGVYCTGRVLDFADPQILPGTVSIEASGVSLPDTGYFQVSAGPGCEVAEPLSFTVDDPNAEFEFPATVWAVPATTSEIRVIYTPHDVGADTLVIHGEEPDGDLVDIVVYGTVTGSPAAVPGDRPPRGYRLDVYPNPFNPATVVSFTVERPVHVRLSVYGLDGRKITTLVDHAVSAGEHTVRWNGRNSRGERVTSGLYFCRLEAGSTILTRRMLLLR